MAVNIVTGMTGKAHITSDDDRAKNVLSFGTGKYVMDFGRKFETSILSNNQIRVYDGMCINQGTQMGIELNDYEDVTIENGVSGSNRNDLIVMRYERNADTAIEKASLVVIKGETGETATDPSYNSGNILDGGDLIDDMPLYRVKIESLTIASVEPLFEVRTNSSVQYAQRLSNTSAIGSAIKPVYFNASGVPVAGTYTLGAACAKGVSTSVTSGDTNLVTGGAVSSAIEASTSYEEGTFTCYLHNTSGTKIASNTGYYKKVGNMVYVFAFILYTGDDTPYYISGLPFNHLGNVSASNRSELFYSTGKNIGRPVQTNKGNSVLFDTSSITGDSWDIWGWYRIA